MFWSFVRDGRKAQYDAVHIPFSSNPLRFGPWAAKQYSVLKYREKGKRVPPVDLS